ncbi:hypothetical protein BGW38_007070 [Lunasporangiospora selenospora]|uniref:Methyltransferase domain-containing protein n=1 Tax=Lunasporangiospora selenospora TaxID=979761 RepID=A0A9P6FLI0_9FUNG|nr:hypothetical protein BGW38_007070 [Lunasporangiospora selenospora]
MGNAKSRHANTSGPSSKKHNKYSSGAHHSQRQSRNQYDNDSLSEHHHSIPNDSGHYSNHRSNGANNGPDQGNPGRHGDFPGGSYHTNFSSPSRLGQKKASDSSLQQKYSSRNKRATGNGGGGGGNGYNANNHSSSNINITHSNNNNNNNNGYGGGLTSSYHNLNSSDMPLSSGIGRATGMTSTRAAMGMSTGDLNGGTGGYSTQEMMYNDTRPSSISPRPSQGRLVGGGGGGDRNGHHMQSGYPRVSSTSPTPQGHREEENYGLGDAMHSLAAVSLGMNNANNAGGQNGNPYYAQQRQQDLDYDDMAYGKQRGHQQHQTNGNKQYQGMNGDLDLQDQRTRAGEIRANNKGYGNKPSASGVGPGGMTPVTKTTDLFADAGPLLDGGRTLGPDQVFARLAKQYPTNPRESDKRERIYKWLDLVAKALILNPNTDQPGWIIPIIPDELDRPESPYYLDRVTYELDLIAPFGKPFRKAIDINCASGEWAMDIAIKYPRTIVYALDPFLDMPSLPPRVPENLKFKMRDVKDQEGEFDLVHQRLGAFRTQIQEWTPHFAELGRLTRPGGWIQLAESNGMVVRAGVESLKVNRWVEKAAMSTGLNPMQMVEALMPTILGAGLINVECYEYGIPIGEWAGRRGVIAMKSYLAMVESLREEVIEMNRLEEGIFEETIEAMKVECVQECAELVMKVICAQKPPMTDDLWRYKS